MNLDISSSLHIQFNNFDIYDQQQKQYQRLKMSRISDLINGLQKSESPQLWEELMAQISKPNLFKISKQQDKQVQQNALQQFLRNQLGKPKQELFVRLKQYIKIAYGNKNELLSILYRILPLLMQKYIQINYVKLQGLQQCLIDIYNNQLRSYNDAQIQRNELSKDVAIRTLYQTHLGKQMSSPTVQNLQPINQINNSSRNDLKTLMFYLMYREAHSLGSQSLADYYKALFIYCGADEKDLNTGSLYLLEKISKISIFRYPITQAELQWIILTLYELCTQVKKDKFDLLAVVNAIHKKVSNESLFRMSDLANSLIHLLEDEYSEVFS